MRHLSPPVASFLIALLSVACGAESTSPARTAADRPATQSAESPRREAASAPDRTQVTIADEIRRACGLGEPETYFSYDSSRIDGSSRRILSKLASCFQSGPLANRSMILVGHADPRGDDEYNYALGGRRADAVRRTLGDLGLRDDRMSTSSRGELDATGSDETTWSRDRRVDVLLGG